MPDDPDRFATPLERRADAVEEVLAEEVDDDRPFGSVASVQRIGLDLRAGLDDPPHHGRLGERASDHVDPWPPLDDQG